MLEVLPQETPILETVTEVPQVPTVETVPSVLLAEFIAAMKASQEARSQVQKAQTHAVKAEGVLEYVSKRIAVECKIGPEDTISEDGTITRA